MNFNWILDSVAGQVPAVDPGLVATSYDGGVHLSYGDLRESSLRYARAMQELGLKKGDRLGLMLYNDAEYLPLYFAAARLGLITVRLNFRLAPIELGFMLSDAGCDVVIIHSSLLDRAEPVRDEAGVRTYVVLSDSADPVPGWAEPFAVLQTAEQLALDEIDPVDGDDPMTLLYTSGTTGQPKGAVWTHRNTLAIAEMQALKWRFSEETVALVPGPLYHGGGFEAILSAVFLTHGTAVWMPSGSFTIDHLLELIQAESVTDALVFSFMLNELVRLDDLHARVPSSLRRIMVGGDTLMPWVFDEVARRLPNIELVQLYGLSEGGAIATTLDHRDFKAQPKSVGRPMPLAEVRIVRPDGTLAATEEVAEIEIRSPAVSPGYWQRPDANRETFADGWCRTGDLGFVNTEGFLTLAGRAKDMIRSGGENIYPAEVEKVLTGHPGVQDAAVIAVADERFGEVGCALVVASAVAAEDAELRAFCRQALAGYKVPKYFVRVDDLPRNASGKVLKHVLRAEYGGMVGATR